MQLLQHLTTCVNATALCLHLHKQTFLLKLLTTTVIVESTVSKHVKG